MRLRFFSFSGASSAACLLILSLPIATACGGGFTPRRPLTLEVGRSDHPLSPVACELPDRAAPTGGTPVPATSGGLTVADRHGDDRLGVHGHFAAAWSPDGVEVFTATASGVQVWSAESGVLLRSVEFDEALERPSALTLSRDGLRLVVQGTTHDDSPRAWIGATETLELRSLPEPSAEDVFFTDSELIGGGRRWSLDTLEVDTDAPVERARRMLPDGLRVLAFVPAPNEGYLPEIRVARSGEVLHRFDAVRLPQSVAISGDGRRIAVLRGALTVFDATSYEPLAHFDVGDSSMVSLSSDGRSAVVEGLVCLNLERAAGGDGEGCQNPIMELWDVDAAERRWASSRHAGERWIFGPGDRVLTGPKTRMVSEFLRVEDGSEIPLGYSVPVISPDGRRALIRTSTGASFVAIDPAAQTWSREPRYEIDALSRNGRVGIVTDHRRHLQLHGDTCIDLGDVREAGHPLHLTLDGTRLLTLARDHNAQRLRAIDTRTGELIWSIELSGEGGSGAGVVASENVVLVQGTDHDDVLRFDATSGDRLADGYAPRRSYESFPGQPGRVHEVRDVDGDRVSHLASSGSGRGVLFANPETLASRSWLSIWNLEAPEVVDDLPVDGIVTVTRLSSDGAFVGTGRRDGGVSWYELESEAWVDGGVAHRGGVTVVRFATGVVASAAGDGTIHVYDMDSGRLLGSAQLWNDQAVQLAWTTDEELVVETEGRMRIRFTFAR